jgi:sugar phosphate isomerase/epimerase
VADAVRRATAEAAAAGIRVALEWHGGTLTDDAESAARLLAEAGDTATYWQPAEGMADEPALAGLRRVRERVSAVHVFAWWPGNHRLRLAERADLWRAAFGLLAGAEIDALLEFVPDDDPDLVAAEAGTLRELISGAAT